MTVLAPDHQRILDVLDERQSAGQGPLKAKEITVDLGLQTTSAKVEGVRSKARAPGGARVARAGDIGDAQRRPAARGRAGRRPIRVTIGHRIIASLLAGNVGLPPSPPGMRERHQPGRG